jgi:hypothetical protein
MSSLYGAWCQSVASYSKLGEKVCVQKKKTRRKNSAPGLCVAALKLGASSSQIRYSAEEREGCRLDVKLSTPRASKPASRIL